MTHPMSLTHYLVLTDFGTPHGWANGADPQTSFADACNEWQEQMAQGRPSVVLEAQINAPLIDVTDVARKTVLRWLAGRSVPDWLMDETQTFGAAA